jgi:hypothetical protein
MMLSTIYFWWYFEHYTYTHQSKKITIISLPSIARFRNGCVEHHWMNFILPLACWFMEDFFNLYVNTQSCCIKWKDRNISFPCSRYAGSDVCKVHSRASNSQMHNGNVLWHDQHCCSKCIGHICKQHAQRSTWEDIKGKQFCSELHVIWWHNLWHNDTNFLPYQGTSKQQ